MVLRTMCRAKKKTFWISSMQYIDFLCAFTSLCHVQGQHSKFLYRLAVVGWMGNITKQISGRFCPNCKYFISPSSFYLWLISRAFCNFFLYNARGFSSPSIATLLGVLPKVKIKKKKKNHAFILKRNFNAASSPGKQAVSASGRASWTC